MNKTFPALIVTTLLVATSFSTLAATQVDESQASTLQSIGTVSISGVRGSLDDATHQLAKKADAMGATRYRVIGVDTPGDSSQWTGNAEIYR
ncbi:DUF1471 domain-containing protein [Pseudomonas cerasi]